MVHYSKKDSWLIGFILAGSMIPLVLGLFFLFVGGPNRNAGYLLLVIVVVEGVVMLLLTYPLYYEVTTSELIVRCGVLMNRHISLGAIDEVQPDRNAVSSPAWSLDRLRIDYRKNGERVSLLISPESKAAFMQELSRFDSDLKMSGDRLIRESASK